MAEEQPPIEIHVHPKPGPKGDPGEKPIKGVDYWTEEEKAEFVRIILALIPRPQDGLPGKDAIVDYTKIEAFITEKIEELPKPKNAEKIDINSIIKSVLKEIPKQKDIDYPALKQFCLDETRKIEDGRESRIRTLNSAGPTTRLWELVDVDVDNISPGQVLSWNGSRWVPANAGSGSGLIVETPVGSLYDQTTGLGGLVFSVTEEPDWIVADGGTFFDGAGYTYSALTVTMVNPVTQFIRSFRQ